MTSVKTALVLQLVAYVAAKAIQEQPIVLVISFDGFRYDYFNDTATPWINALRENGIKVPYMEPVFPTQTFPNHQSIATGVYPEVHGVIDNFFYDPLYNRTMTGFNEDPQYWNYNPEALPIWISNELAGQGRHSGCYMWPGCSVRYGWHHDILPTFNVTPVYNESTPWRDRVDTVINWMTDETKPANLIFMYYSQPDSIAHSYGPNSKQRDEAVVKIDSYLGYLVQRLIQFDLFEKTNMILLADHGTREISLDKVIPLIEFINATQLVDKIRGSTKLLHVKVKDEKLNEAYAEIKAFSRRYSFTVLKKDELRAPYYHYATRRNADLTIIADPGYVFDDFVKSVEQMEKDGKVPPSVNGTGKFGTHGYISSVPEMRPFFVAHGPAFKRGYNQSPFKNVDVFPLIARILKIPETKSNGSLSNVMTMLRGQATSSSSAVRNLKIGFWLALFSIMYPFCLFFRY